MAEINWFPPEHNFICTLKIVLTVKRFIAFLVSSLFFDQLKMSNQSLTARATDLPFSHRSVWFQLHRNRTLFAAKHLFVGSY